MIEATTSAIHGRRQNWDAVVIGAGPAGAVTALGLARRGVAVLLVDRRNFPRAKVCGGCLNGDSVTALRSLGLGPNLDGLGGTPLDRFCVLAGGRQLSLELPTGLAVSRYRLDAMLVEAAIEAGADFLPSTRMGVNRGKPGQAFREVTCSEQGRPLNLRARVVVLATGLAADLHIDDPDLAIRQSPGSRIGVATTATSYPDYYEPGTIFMAVSRSGYVGLTRTEDHVLNIAAALDVASVRALNPAAVCERILVDAAFPVTQSMLSGDWSGTIGLTRSRVKPSSERLFVVGDAAGYVEPFTGEGMAWAIRGGRAVVPFALKAVNDWYGKMSDEWSDELQTLVARSQKLCRALAWGLRYPLLVHGMLGAVGIMPGLGRIIIRRLNRESELEFSNTRPGHSSAA